MADDPVAGDASELASETDDFEEVENVAIDLDPDLALKLRDFLEAGVAAGIPPYGRTYHATEDDKADRQGLTDLRRFLAKNRFVRQRYLDRLRAQAGV